jgi:hypothetical protein
MMNPDGPDPICLTEDTGGGNGFPAPSPLPRGACRSSPGSGLEVPDLTR